MFASDRSFIENKYHKVSEPFNPFFRMAYHGYEFDPNTGLDDEQIKSGLENWIKKFPVSLIRLSKQKPLGMCWKTHAST